MSEYKDCQYFFEGKCRCMDYSFNQDFYECPQCRDVSYCYYKQLKRCEAKLEKIKKICDSYARTEDYVICSTFNEFLDKVFNIVIGAEE